MAAATILQTSLAKTHARALAKAVTWRALDMLGAYVWGFLVTGHAPAASAIASLETFTKIGLFYLHELAWRLIRKGANSRARSLLKAISWRVVGSADTALLSLLATGSMKYALSIASIETVTKILIYYIHERLWRAVPWGRLEESDAADAQAQLRSDL